MCPSGWLRRIGWNLPPYLVCRLLCEKTGCCLYSVALPLRQFPAIVLPSPPVLPSGSATDRLRPSKPSLSTTRCDVVVNPRLLWHSTAKQEKPGCDTTFFPTQHAKTPWVASSMGNDTARGTHTHKPIHICTATYTHALLDTEWSPDPASGTHSIPTGPFAMNVHGCICRCM